MGKLTLWHHSNVIRRWLVLNGTWWLVSMERLDNSRSWRTCCKNLEHLGRTRINFIATWLCFHEKLTILQFDGETTDPLWFIRGWHIKHNMRRWCFNTTGAHLQGVLIKRASKSPKKRTNQLMIPLMKAHASLWSTCICNSNYSYF